MKRSMFAAVAVGFGLLASMAGAQAASPLAGAPAVAAANAAVAQGNTVTKVWLDPTVRSGRATDGVQASDGCRLPSLVPW